MATLIGSISSRFSNSIRAMLTTTNRNVFIPKATFLTGSWNNLPSVNNTTCRSASIVLGQYTTKRFGHCFPQFANLPPVNRLAGKGDTYQTNIYRKRQLKDPNEPSLVYMETLKWTTIRMLRDVRRRHVFKRYYLNRSCLKNIQKCRMLPNSIRVCILTTFLLHYLY